MKTFLFVVLASISLVFSSTSTTFTTERIFLEQKKEISLSDNDGYTYIYEWIEGKLWVFIYDGDTLVASYEIDE